MKQLSAALSASERQERAAKAQAADLEARWHQLSAVSDEALREADEAKQQALLLRRAVEEKDQREAQANEAREGLERRLLEAQTRADRLEATFQERLVREVSQKEQELIEEVSYLRKSAEVKEKRIQELTTQRALLERNELARRGTSPDPMLEAHVAIAKAFGDVALETPLLRMVDEPTLKLTAALFRHPVLRRSFFAVSLVLWLFALRSAMSPAL